MKYKIYVFCPDDEGMVDTIINVAANAGAGVIGNYTHCAFIQRGQGNWFSQQAQPEVQSAGGPVNQMARVGEVKIEMVCPAERASLVIEAIKGVHPYDEPMFDIVKLEEI